MCMPFRVQQILYEEYKQGEGEDPAFVCIQLLLQRQKFQEQFIIAIDEEEETFKSLQIKIINKLQQFNESGKGIFCKCKIKLDSIQPYIIYYKNKKYQNDQN